MLGSFGTSDRTMFAMARRETAFTAQRIVAAEQLMACGCGVVLPCLAGVPLEQRFLADDRDTTALVQVLVDSGIATVKDWKKSGRDAAKYLLLTLQRWIRDHGGASIERRFDLDIAKDI